MPMRLTAALFLLFAACDAKEGERCNPLQYSDNGIQGNCESGLACIYPTTPGCNPSQPGSNCCGVAYCCKLDPLYVVSTDPNCQPDPNAIAACMLDLSPAPDDAGTSD
jgi:hypothetical protein